MFTKDIEELIRKYRISLENKIVLIVPPDEDEYPQFWGRIIKHKQNDYFEIEELNTHRVFSVHTDFMDFTNLYALVNKTYDEDTGNSNFELKT